MPAESGDVTLLLRCLTGQDDAGRKQTYDRLISLVYDDLRRRARQQMRKECDWHTMQATALVHEAYERLIHYDMGYKNREHFLNVAVAAMRRLLIDYARNKKSFKRGGDQERTLLNDGETAIGTLLQSPEESIDLDKALESPRPD